VRAHRLEGVALVAFGLVVLVVACGPSQQQRVNARTAKAGAAYLDLDQREADAEKSCDEGPPAALASCDIQIKTADGDLFTVAAGTLTIQADITRAT